MIRYWRVFALALALMGIGSYQIYGLFSNEGYQPKQPIAFSHVLHAGVLQMECLYCHSGAEKSAHAAIPSVDLCMGCHSIVQTASPEIQKLAEYYENNEPVPWVRIHDLPDHAYFSHKWHVEAGVSCQECHGPIQSMPVVKQWRKLEMGDCMACHTDDNYADQVRHAPTYHEQPLEAGHEGHDHEGHDHDSSEHADAYPESGIAALGTEEGLVVPADNSDVRYTSALGYMNAHYDVASMSTEEARVLLTRLENYKKNIYAHGRAVQLRGQNASIECSTCHN